MRAPKWVWVVAVAMMAAAFVLAFSGAGELAAEVRSQLPPGLRADPYVVELDKMLEEWNSARLRLPAKAQLAEEIDARLKNVVEAKQYAYQTADWAKTLRTRFAALPADVKAEIKLTDPAALILMSLFIEGLEEFRKQVPVNKTRREISLPLFMILSRAQEVAKSRDRKQIDSRSLFVSLNSWWTAIWPFCD